MDNLTHSFFAATIGQTGLKKKSGLGMAALVIGANIPDIDATCTLWGTQALAMRRGLTHGPLGLLILPLLVTGLLLLLDRWQTRRGTRPVDRLPVHKGWLLALSYIGTLTHPLLDWMNSYGVRLLEPFSSRWFYGDVLFIIDLVLWILLIGRYFWSRRAEKRSTGNWRRRGGVIVASACAYILVNGAITGAAEAQGYRLLHDHHFDAQEVVANPVPLAFWKRHMLWRTRDGAYGQYAYDPLSSGGDAPVLRRDRHTGMDNPALPAMIARDRDAQAFLFWSRLPLAQMQPDGTLILRDQRFLNAAAASSFTVTIPPPRHP